MPRARRRPVAAVHLQADRALVHGERPVEVGDDQFGGADAGGVGKGRAGGRDGGGGRGVRRAHVSRRRVVASASISGTACDGGRARLLENNRRATLCPRQLICVTVPQTTARPRAGGERVGRMHSNEWLAIDVGTAPMVRAQEVRFAWERFVQDLAGPSGERRRRSRADPRADRRLVAALARRRRRPRRTTSRPSWPTTTTSTRCGTSTRSPAPRRSSASAWPRRPTRPATSSSSATPTACCCCIEGSNRIRMRAADSMNFAEGTLWSEPRRGHERDRHRAGRRPRRAGLRPRALQRGRPALDVLGRADPRPRHRARCSASSTSPATSRPCTRRAWPWPRRPPPPSRPRCGSPCRSATPRCAPATASAWPPRPASRALVSATGRAITELPARLGRRPAAWPSRSAAAS